MLIPSQHSKSYKAQRTLICPNNVDTTATLTTRPKNVRHWKTRLKNLYKLATCASSSRVQTWVPIDPPQGRNILGGTNEGNLILAIITMMTNDLKINNEGVELWEGSSLREEAVVKKSTWSQENLHVEGVQSLLGRNIYGLLNRCTRPQLKTDQEYPQDSSLMLTSQLLILPKMTPCSSLLKLETLSSQKC